MSLTNTGLSRAIADAFALEYEAQKGKALPSAGEEDRKLLFDAIARGVLTYLMENDRVMISNITLGHTATPDDDRFYNEVTVNLNITITTPPGSA